ncbi:MAG: 3'-5' exonuclease [Spirochaetia bacterium]|nr:3'-5' exonuclease [Spirochaetia bacterium]
MTESKSYSVIDLETSSLSPKNGGRIIEIGLIQIDEDGNILDRFSSLVNPEGPAGATHIHGLSSSMLKDAPVFSELVGNIIPFLRESILVAHNIPFDRGFLLAELYNAGIPVESLPSLCTLRLSRRLFPYLRSRSLGPLCDYLGISLERAHTALADCAATVHLLRYIQNYADHQADFSLDSFIENPDVQFNWPDMAPSSNIVTRDFL